MAVVGPMPKPSAIGARYANGGIVCMMSSTGVIAAETLRRRAIAMPNGSPMTMQVATAMPVTSSRSMLSCQSPNTPNSRKVITTSRVCRRPAQAQAIQVAMPTTPSQPIWGTGRGTPGC